MWDSTNNSTSLARQKSAKHSGFTLIELMTTVAIVAILMAIALPAYRQYTVKNAESQVQAKMKQLSIELESWRATSLTYRGFVPRKLANDGTVSFGYDSAKTILVPSTNTQYTITLESGSGSDLTAAPVAGSTVYNTWRMSAVPNASLTSYGARNISLNNQGLACAGIVDLSAINSTATSCPTGATVW